MTSFHVNQFRRDGHVRLAAGADSLTQDGKTLSLDVIRRMLWFCEEYRDAEDLPAPQLLVDLFDGANKAIVQMQLNRLAAQRLMGG